MRNEIGRHSDGETLRKVATASPASTSLKPIMQTPGSTFLRSVQ